jgi:ABC-type transporter Mla maintaining outer membrane lipid asymmetry ATPase subunit MlaF
MNPGANPILQLQGVTVSSLREASVPVLAGVNWTVAPGEFWVVAGRQHSGKTDLLLTAAGLLPPLAGVCRLLGRDTRDFGGAELAERRQLGLVFANGRLFNELTLGENIALPLCYHRHLTGPAAEREIRPLLERLELTPLAAAAPATVSLDWLKRAALARALALQPQVLLCDQPLGGLGLRHRQWWLQFLDQLARGQDGLGGPPMTLVVTTEELPPWQHPARRFAFLRDHQFFPLGDWTALARVADPALRELLAAPAESPAPPL